MPLRWDLTNTDLIKRHEAYYEFVVVMVGLDVLKRKVGGYNYSFYQSELDRKTMTALKRRYKAKLKKAHTEDSKEFYTEIINALPKLVGAKFYRAMASRG